MIRRAVLACAALGCALTLASCSGSGASDTGSDQPGSGVPSYATENSRHGAQQFAAYWVDSLNQATTSGDTAQLKTLALDSCDVCADFAAHLDRIYAAGGHVDTDGWKVTSVVPVAGQPDNLPGFQVQADVAPQTVYESKDAKPEKYKGGTESMQMFIKRVDDHWMVDRINP